jgi:transcriptional regulator
MAQKRFTSVSEMVREISEDRSFVEGFERRMRDRRIIKALLVLRVVRGWNQKDIADRLGCTQSRISKLESSADGDLRLADLRDYASALGQSVEIQIRRKI